MGDLIPINTIYRAIQGEGVLAGTPMIIVRTQGCDVGCPWCDTKETWTMTPEAEVSLDDAVLRQGAEQVALVGPIELATFLSRKYQWFSRWVLITGGEPALHNLDPLSRALHGFGLKIALETSGTEPIRGAFDWVCISPKINMPGKKKILPEALTRADEIKFVVGRPLDIEQADYLLEDSSLEGVKLKQGVVISLQPISQSERATELCVKTCMERGWRLSLQLHKYLHLP